MRVSRLDIGQPQQAWLLAAGTVAAVLAALYALHLPLVGRLRDRWAEADELRIKLEDSKAVSQQLPGQEQELEQALPRLQRSVEAQLGARQSVARILEALSQQAKAQQCDLVAVQSKAEQQTRSVSLGPQLRLREVVLSVKLSGRYAQLGEFLGWLPDAPFLASVRSVRISQPDAARPALQADVDLAVYLSEERSQPTAESTPEAAATALPEAASGQIARRAQQREAARHIEWKRDPFTFASTASGVGALALSGILWDAHQPMAIINGEPRQVGDSLDGYQITAILQDRVTLTDGTQTFTLSIAP